LKVLIADDHPVIRRGVKQILSEDMINVHFGEAANAKEALAKINSKVWDILILDINLPDMNGLEVLRQVKLLKSDLPVLILTVMDEDQIAVRVLKAGASGFMTKDTIPEELVAAVKKIQSGARYVSASLAEKLVFNMYDDNEKPPHYKLSDREYQVLCMIGIGGTIKQIADKLYLSEQTIRTYRMRIFEKMNMQTDAEIIHYTVKHSLT